MKKIVLFTILLTLSIALRAQTSVKILFDATKAQMAGNADWVIDADVFNIGTGTGGIMQTGKGNEANPQRIPTPAQSGITSTTAETYWKGALSAWAVAMVKKGFIVETLPYNGLISYGNSSNPQDLSNYKVYIIDEPNIKFTSAEKTAILQFVQNGGGLFMISDHTSSDRNNDGWDSPAIFNDLMTNNGSVTNPFGISFDLQNFSQTTTNFANLPANTILHGVAGNPTSMKFSNGTSMTLSTTANANVRGLVYKTGSSNTGLTGVMFAQSRYGTGKVAAMGDSSPAEDGTGDTNDQLYNGWTGDVSGDHSRLLTNATIWLSNNVIRVSDDELSNATEKVNIWPNPFAGNFNVGFYSNATDAYTITVYDISGRSVMHNTYDANGNYNQAVIDATNLNSGIYILSIKTGNDIINTRVVKY